MKKLPAVLTALPSATFVCAIVLCILGSLRADTGTVRDAYNVNALIYMADILPWISAGALILAITGKKCISLNFPDLLFTALTLFLALNLRTLPWNREYILTVFCTYMIVRIAAGKARFGIAAAAVAAVAVSVAESILAVKQLAGFSQPNHALFPFTGSMPNPGPLCGILAVIFPIAVSMSMAKIPRILSFSAFASAVLTAAILSSGASRTALVAVSASSLFLFSGQICEFYDRRRKTAIIWISAAVLLIAALSAAMLMMRPESALGRVLLWKCALRTVAGSPITGAGAGGFSCAYGEVQAEYLSSGNASAEEILVADVPLYAFNEYLQLGIEGGIIATLLFTALLVSIFIRCRNSCSIYAKGFGGSIISFAVFAFASYPLQCVPFCMLAATIAATAAGLPQKSDCGYTDLRRKAEPCRSVLPQTAAALAVLALSVFISTNRTYSEKDINAWSSEKRFFDMDIFRTTVDNYGSLYPVFKDNYAFLFEYGQALSRTGDFAGSDSILLRGASLYYDPMFINILGKNAAAREDFAEAETLFKQALRMLPNRIYPRMLLFRLYMQQNDTLNAVKWGESVMTERPKIMSDAITDMQNEVAASFSFLDNRNPENERER